MAFFDRNGTELRPNHEVDGKPVFVRARRCGRCGGAGRSEKWRHTGLVCYDCNGVGTRGSETVKLYTADQLAKLDATKAKRDAKRMAAAVEAETVAAAEAAVRREAFEGQHADMLSWLRANAQGNEFLSDVLAAADRRAALSDAQIAAVAAFRAARLRIEENRAASEHVGSVGDRIELVATVETKAGFYRPAFGSYGADEFVVVTTLRDAARNAYVVKSPKFNPAKGSEVRIKGTVKAHSEFRGQKQTELQRVAGAWLAASRED